MKEEKNSVPLSFWEHLDVLRGYLMKMAIAVAALFVVAFLFKDALFDVVLAPKNNDFITYQLFRSVAGRLGLGTMENFSVDLINTGLADQFLIHIRVAFFVALLCASPFLLYLLFRFISPALYEREKLYVLKVIPGAYLMFILGVSLCYFIIALHYRHKASA